MKRITAFFLMAGLLLSLCGCAGVNLNFSGVSPFRNIRDEGLIEAIDSAVNDFAGEEGINKLSVGVIKGKETRFVNLGDGMNEHSVMPIGTMTTMFTGMLVANFEYKDNRWIDRDQYLADWISTPSPLPKLNGRDVKLWQLACNVSGLGDINDYGNGYVTAGMVYNQLESAGYIFNIGEDIYESSMGYALLCECLRQAYNMNADFVNLITNQVIVKMGLEDSRFFRRDALAGYDGYESTTYDLLKVVGYCGGMLDYDEILTDAIQRSLAEQWSDGETTLSMSFNIDKSDGQAVYFKAGESDEGCVYIAFIPEAEAGVAITCQDKADLGPLADRLLEIVK